MVTREMAAEEAKQELEIVHTALIGTVDELEGHGLHSATIVEALIALAVQVAVRDWGPEGAKAILNDTLNARLLPPPSAKWLRRPISAHRNSLPARTTGPNGSLWR